MQFFERLNIHSNFLVQISLEIGIGLIQFDNVMTSPCSKLQFLFQCCRDFFGLKKAYYMVIRGIYYQYPALQLKEMGGVK